MNGEIKLKIFETHSSAITNFSQENFLLNILLDRDIRTTNTLQQQIWIHDITIIGKYEYYMGDKTINTEGQK